MGREINGLKNVIGRKKGEERGLAEIAYAQSLAAQKLTIESIDIAEPAEIKKDAKTFGEEFGSPDMQAVAIAKRLACVAHVSDSHDLWSRRITLKRSL